jgi:hypothetical protein
MNMQRKIINGTKKKKANRLVNGTKKKKANRLVPKKKKKSLHVTFNKYVYVNTYENSLLHL